MMEIISELDALRRENAALRAWQAETRMVLRNTAITPAWRVMSLLLWECYGDRLDRADPATGDVPIHIPELTARYGGCEKQTGNTLTAMAAAGCFGYRIEKTQTETGEYRNRARFRAPATTREAWCGLASGWSHDSHVGRPPVDLTPADLPLEMETQPQQRTRYTTYTSGAAGRQRRVVKTDHTSWQNIGSPRLEVLDSERAEIISHEIALVLLGELRGIPATPAGRIAPDRQPWPGPGNNFRRRAEETPTPPAEPEEWGNDDYPLWA